MALGIASFVNIFNPQMVVLAGFLASLFDYDKDRVVRMVKEHALDASSESVIIRNGELGSDLLMIGAAELPFAKLLERPSQFDFDMNRKHARR